MGQAGTRLPTTIFTPPFFRRSQKALPLSSTSRPLTGFRAGHGRQQRTRTAFRKRIFFIKSTVNNQLVKPRFIGSSSPPGSWKNSSRSRSTLLSVIQMPASMQRSSRTWMEKPSLVTNVHCGCGGREPALATLVISRLNFPLPLRGREGTS